MLDRFRDVPGRRLAVTEVEEQWGGMRGMQRIRLLFATSSAPCAGAVKPQNSGYFGLVVGVWLEAALVPLFLRVVPVVPLFS